MNYNIIQRINYFSGQYLTTDDFETEQAYLINKSRYQYRSLDVWGIAYGLNVQLNSDQSITISPGMAIDGQGREIILLDAHTLRVESSDEDTEATDQGSKYVTIAYGEEPAEYTSQTSKSDHDASGFTRTVERPLVRIRPPLAGSLKVEIYLATITLEKGQFEVNTKNRKYVGTRVSEVNFALPGEGDQQAVAIKRVVQNGQTNLQVQAPSTLFLGNLALMPSPHPSPTGGKLGIGTANPQSALHLVSERLHVAANSLSKAIDGKTLLLRIEGEQGLQLAVDTQGQTYSAGSLYLDQNSLIASPLNSRSPNSLLLCDDQNNCQLTAPESTLSLTAKAIQLNGTLEHEDIGFWKKVKTNPSDIYFASGTVSIGTDTSSDAQLYVKATGDAKGPSLQVDGLTNLATLTVSGSATISNTLKVSKSATISDTLLIEGNTAIHTAGVENSNLTVYKNFDNKITSQSTAQFISSKITSIHFKSTDNITTSINAIDKGTKNDKEVSCFMPIKVDHDGRYLFYLDYNGHVYQSSDQNLKTHIRLLDDALDKVRALQGVSYLRSDSAFQGKRQIGLIAQEVEKVLPELVSTHQDGTKFVAYVPLIPVLLEAIKVLDTKVSAMENLSRKKESLLQSIVNRFVGLA